MWEKPLGSGGGRGGGGTLTATTCVYTINTHSPGSRDRIRRSPADSENQTGKNTALKKTNKWEKKKKQAASEGWQEKKKKTQTTPQSKYNDFTVLEKALQKATLQEKSTFWQTAQDQKIEKEIIRKKEKKRKRL